MGEGESFNIGELPTCRTIALFRLEGFSDE